MLSRSSVCSTCLPRSIRCLPLNLCTLSQEHSSAMLMADGVEYSGASCNLLNRLMYEHTAMYEHPMTTVIERVPLRLGFQRSSWTPKTSSTRSQMPRHIQEIRVLHWSWCGQQLEIRSNALSCAVF